MFDSPENDQLFNYTFRNPPKNCKILRTKKKIKSNI